MVLVGIIYLINILQISGILPYTLEIEHGYEQFVLMVSAGMFVLGLLFRLFTMHLQANGFRFRYIAGITILTITAPFTLYGLVAANHAWTNRAPNQACFETQHKVRIANSDFRMSLDGSSGIVPVILLNTKIRHRLRRNIEHRWFCNEIKKAGNNIEFPGLGFSFHPPFLKKTYCADEKSTVLWIVQICQNIVLPQNLELFAAIDWAGKMSAIVRTKARVANRSPIKNKSGIVYSGKVTPKFYGSNTQQHYIVLPHYNTPDGKALTTVCKGLIFEPNEGAYVRPIQCKVSYILEEGLILEYNFLSTQEKIAETARVVDLWTRSYIDAHRW